MAQDGIFGVQPLALPLSPVSDVRVPLCAASFGEKAALWSSCYFPWDCTEKSPCAFPYNIQAFI